MARSISLLCVVLAVGCSKEASPPTPAASNAPVAPRPTASAVVLASAPVAPAPPPPASAAPAPAPADSAAEAKLLGACCAQIDKANTAGQLETQGAFCADQRRAILKGKATREEALKKVRSMLEGTLKTPPACR